MEEIDYIAATNLAKVRIADHILKDILSGFDGVTTEDDQLAVRKILRKWEDGLSKMMGKPKTF